MANLQPYSNFESTTAQPTDTLNCTALLDTAQHQQGTKSLKVTSSSTNWAFDFDADTALHVPVSAATQYTYSIYVYTTAAARQITLNGGWFGGSGFISNPVGVTASLTQNAWTRISWTENSPAGATYFSLKIYTANTWASGDVAWFDAAQMEAAGTASAWTAGPNDSTNATGTASVVITAVGGLATAIAAPAQANIVVTAPAGGFTSTVSSDPVPQAASQGTRWAFAIGDWRGLPQFELSRITSRKVVWRLGNDGTGTSNNSEASFTIDGTLPEAKQISELISDLWVLRNGQALYRGRVGASTVSGDDKSQTASYSTADYRALLSRRLIYDTDTLVYPAQEQTSTVWALIAQTQGKPGGTLNLIRGNATGALAGAQQYTPGASVGDSVVQLAMAQGGFDWDITPNVKTITQTFDAWYPQRGRDRQRVLDYPGQLASYNRQVDPASYANALRVTGTDGLGAVNVTSPTVASDAAGRFDGQYANPDVLTSSALHALAAAQMTTMQNVQPVYTVTLAPGKWQGPNDIWLGDPVIIAIKHGLLDVVESLRVFEISLSLDDGSDTETVELTLGGPKPDRRWLLHVLQAGITNLKRR